VQKAHEAELDRNPQVLQAIESAKNRVLAQAFMQSVMINVPSPTASEIADYYKTHPNLFAKRKIYQLQEFTIGGDLTAEDLDAQVSKAKSVKEFTTWLKDNKVPAKAQLVTKAAESLPLVFLPAIAGTPDGKGVVISTDRGVHVLWVAASKPSPMNLEQATPVITQFLTKQKRRDAIQDEIQKIRSAASIEMMGEFANMDAGASTAKVEDTLQQESETENESDEVMEKGVSGLK
jgi:hypothetical protein